MVKAYLVLLALLAVERGVELLVSRRHAAWARARGGFEVGRRHFALMALLHGAFLLGCAAEVLLLRRPLLPPLAAAMLLLLVAAQALRYWAIFSLGPLWNVRVFVVPGHPVVTRGPYRLVRHPNYVAVILEGIAVPLLHSAWITAAAFTALDGVLLAVRIRCEERALAERTDYTRRAGALPRFLPRQIGGGA